MDFQQYRAKTYEILEVRESGSLPSRRVAIALQILIVLNVAAAILESVPWIEQAYGPPLAVFEVVSVLIFTVEYLSRVWCAVESDDPRFAHAVWGRLRYMATPFAVIDLMVLLPAYIGWFGGADLRMLRVVRLLRLLKLVRYSRSFFMLVDAMREEARAVAASAFILCILLVTAASLAYFFENPSQPDAFSSIPQAMWWAVVTMTTVGYGDITPITIPGKMIAAVVSIIGIGMVALPAGLIAAGFVNRLHGAGPDADEPQDKQGTHLHLEHVLSELGPEILEAAYAAQTGQAAQPAALHCPHCGNPIPVAQDERQASQSR